MPEPDKVEQSSDPQTVYRKTSWNRWKRWELLPRWALQIILTNLKVTNLYENCLITTGSRLTSLWAVEKPAPGKASQNSDQQRGHRRRSCNRRRRKVLWHQWALQCF